jgi:hypothetical protein
VKRVGQEGAALIAPGVITSDPRLFAVSASS